MAMEDVAVQSFRAERDKELAELRERKPVAQLNEQLFSKNGELLRSPLEKASNQHKNILLEVENTIARGDSSIVSSRRKSLDGKDVGIKDMSITNFYTNQLFQAQEAKKAKEQTVSMLHNWVGIFDGLGAALRLNNGRTKAREYILDDELVGAADRATDAKAETPHMSYSFDNCNDTPPTRIEKKKRPNATVDAAQFSKEETQHNETQKSNSFGKRKESSVHHAISRTAAVDSEADTKRKKMQKPCRVNNSKHASVFSTSDVAARKTSLKSKHQNAAGQTEPNEVFAAPMVTNVDESSRMMGVHTIMGERSVPLDEESNSPRGGNVCPELNTQDVHSAAHSSRVDTHDNVNTHRHCGDKPPGEYAVPPNRCVHDTKKPIPLDPYETISIEEESPLDLLALDRPKNFLSCFDCWRF